MMNSDEVKAALEAKGTQFVTVTFEKKDGTKRVINGLLKPSSKIVGSERGYAQGEAMKARGQVPIYELKAERWKSFYADKVVSVV